MQLRSERVVLRRPEPRDAEDLYEQKNDPLIANALGGFNKGYSMDDIRNWIEFHRTAKDEIVWVISDRVSDRCLGHAGLYQIDYRIRSAEFSMLIGAKTSWGKGLGTEVSHMVLQYGFDYLNLNRIFGSALATNKRALAMDHKVGFRDEGILRKAQYKAGQYVDVVVMAVLRDEYNKTRLQSD